MAGSARIMVPMLPAKPGARHRFGCFACLIVFRKKRRIITSQLLYVSLDLRLLCERTRGTLPWGECTPRRARPPTRGCHQGVGGWRSGTPHAAGLRQTRHGVPRPSGCRRTCRAGRLRHAPRSGTVRLSPDVQAGRLRHALRSGTVRLSPGVQAGRLRHALRRRARREPVEAAVVVVERRMVEINAATLRKPLSDRPQIAHISRACTLRR